MSFNSRNYYELREAFEKKHLAAAETAEARATALSARIDGLAEIDSALRATAARIMGAALSGKEGLSERIAAIKEETQALREARAALLLAHGYPADYTDVHYDCEKCKDLGFVDTKMCECFKKALVLRGYETSGLGALIGKQTFENYSLAYFDGEDRARMQENFDKIRRYADTFDRSSDSLLLMGGTGLGKTHLSSAIAGRVISRGYDVLYTSALHMIAEFEKTKFRGEEDNTDRYFAAELLIIDDLGTELGGSFSEACLYNVIDTRICKGLPTVISTNLTAAQLSERYTGRIFSRLFGVYNPLLFCGKDVRFEKR